MTTTSGRRPLLIAHRGACAVAPEHTIAAYEAAIEAGADALELDVHLTADDQLVVIHDGRLERTTNGRGVVREHTARELKRLDAGRWFGRQFRGQRIQTLPEVLERFRDRSAFGIELKGGSHFYPAIEERLLTVLQIYGVTDRTLVASFDHHALRKCRDLDADIRLGALVVGRLLAPSALAPAGVLNALCLPAELTTAPDVGAAREAGLDCYLWVVNDPARAREVAEWGVAGIITDRPELLRPVLDRLAPGLPGSIPGA
ncbi:MAG TPA: glycerophosphodiester phosphodiesterase family protein [Methylomirabilota bacterium]|jgi:glycerophosphoryl diester phosphodiesterase|nr:glycerophosphodiester phosphodiesterase family protein [Methylomirabilota bacterium]